MPLPYGQKIIGEAEILARIDAMAAEIVTEYKDKQPLFVCLLRGGAPFAARLMFAIAKYDPKFQPELEYMTIKTYGASRQAKASELILDVAPITDATGRHVILLDDVLDKGLTASFAHRHFIEEYKAASVALAVLIQKDRTRDVYPQATFYGFTGPDEWLTGMGMDDPQQATEGNRWLSFVATAQK